MFGGTSSPFCLQLLSKAYSSNNTILQAATLPSNPITVSNYTVSIVHSAFPTSTPTSHPSAACHPGAYWFQGVCKQCEAGMMSDGYHAVSCYRCPAGTFSNGNKCDPCMPGSFSTTKSSTCQLCQLNFYTSSYASEKCLSCDAGKVTPGLGANSEALCVSPATNFIFGIVGLFFVSYLVLRILVSQFHVTSFLRKARVVRKLLSCCNAIMRYVDLLQSGNNRISTRNNNEFTVVQELGSSIREAVIEFQAPPIDKLYKFSEGQQVTFKQQEVEYKFNVTKVDSEKSVQIEATTESVSLIKSAVKIAANTEITFDEKQDSLVGKLGFDDVHEFVLWLYLLKSSGFLYMLRLAGFLKELDDKFLRDKSLLDVEEKRSKESVVVKVVKNILFISLSFLVVVVWIVVGYLYNMMKVFYVFFIMWRGYSFQIDSNFAEVLENLLNKISLALHIPPDFFVVLYPLVWLLSKLSNIHIDLSSVQVSCSGSQAPFEVIINCLILGLVVILIESNYHVLFSVSLNKTVAGVINLLYRDYFRKRAILGDSWNQALSCFYLPSICKDVVFALGLYSLYFLCNFNFVLKILQFCMSFITVKAFFPFHAFDPNCNQIPGFAGIDAGLSGISTCFMYVIGPAVLYTVSIVVVPGLPDISIGENSYLMKVMVSKEKPSGRLLSLGELFNTATKNAVKTLKEKVSHVVFEIPDLIAWIPEKAKLIVEAVKAITKYLIIGFSALSPDIISFFMTRSYLMYVKYTLDKLTPRIKTNDSEESMWNTLEHICFDLLSEDTNTSGTSTSNQAGLKNLVKLGESEKTMKSTKVIYEEECKDKTPSFYSLSWSVYKDLSYKYNCNSSWYVDKLILIVSFTIIGHLFSSIGRYGWYIAVIKLVIITIYQYYNITILTMILLVYDDGSLFRDMERLSMLCIPDV